MMRGKITNSFLWDFSTRVGVQFVGLAIGIILARLLSPAEFGNVGLAIVLIQFTSMFTNFGLSAALVQRKNITEAHLSSSFYLNITVALILSSCFFFRRLISPHSLEIKTWF